MTSFFQKDVNPIEIVVGISTINFTHLNTSIVMIVTIKPKMESAAPMYVRAERALFVTGSLLQSPGTALSQISYIQVHRRH